MTENTVRYGKPSMTNLPYELGRHIIEQIMNSPKPDFTEMDKEVAKLEEQILLERKMEKSE